jgi:hypothetical protein
MLIFIIVILVLLMLACAIVYYLPAPGGPPWIKNALYCLCIAVAFIVIAERAGVLR